ncbi:hypothetical protein [Paracoccus liaowanqingii]|uniref:hypothetical protein n=1 Tax=Paracoccus liaowanqingii TaxID=2560053 RepID=UPI00143DA335
MIITDSWNQPQAIKQIGQHRYDQHPDGAAPDRSFNAHQRCAPMTTTAIAFSAIDAGRQLQGEGDDASTPQSPSHHHCPHAVEIDDAAAVLTQIDANDHNARSPLLPPLNTDILH